MIPRTSSSPLLGPEQQRFMSKYLSKAAAKRVPLNTKRAGKGYYKGKGGTKEGHLTSKARFIVDPKKRLELIVPDFQGFKVGLYCMVGTCIWCSFLGYVKERKSMVRFSHNLCVCVLFLPNLNLVVEAICSVNSIQICSRNTKETRTNLVIVVIHTMSMKLPKTSGGEFRSIPNHLGSCILFFPFFLSPSWSSSRDPTSCEPAVSRSGTNTVLSLSLSP